MRARSEPRFTVQGELSWIRRERGRGSPRKTGEKSFRILERCWTREIIIGTPGNRSFRGSLAAGQMNRHGLGCSLICDLQFLNAALPGVLPGGLITHYKESVWLPIAG